jgi:hypothetical protein
VLLLGEKMLTHAVGFYRYQSDSCGERRSYHVFRLETDSCQRIRKRDPQFFGLTCAARGAEAAKVLPHTSFG